MLLCRVHNQPRIVATAGGMACFRCCAEMARSRSRANAQQASRTGREAAVRYAIVSEATRTQNGEYSAGHEEKIADASLSCLERAARTRVKADIAECGDHVPPMYTMESSTVWPFLLSDAFPKVPTLSLWWSSMALRFASGQFDRRAKGVYLTVLAEALGEET